MSKRHSASEDSSSKRDKSSLKKKNFTRGNPALVNTTVHDMANTRVAIQEMGFKTWFFNRPL